MTEPTTTPSAPDPAAEAARTAGESLARQARAAQEARAEAKGEPIVIKPVQLEPQDQDPFPYEPEKQKTDGEPHGDDLNV